MDQHQASPTIKQQKCPRCGYTLIFRTLSIDGKNILFTQCCGTDLTELVQDWGYPPTFI